MRPRLFQRGKWARDIGNQDVMMLQ